MHLGVLPAPRRRKHHSQQSRTNNVRRSETKRIHYATDITTLHLGRLNLASPCPHGSFKETIYVGSAEVATLHRGKRNKANLCTRCRTRDETLMQRAQELQNYSDTTPLDSGGTESHTVSSVTFTTRREKHKTNLRHKLQ